ncbi:L,D-transpeptidase/peptidoglycan binding protein [Aerococcaceae bacterium NML190938]|nr:L,D-transpeptidase/peptidoglycan binding protein [Aerococcaceae bacterium NML190938]
MKKFLVALFVVLLVAAGYLGGIYYYSDKFVANTHFGQVDVSGLTVAQAVEKIERETNARELTVNEDGASLATVKLGDLETHYDLEPSVTAAFNAQDPVGWAMNFVQGSRFDGVTSKMAKANAEKLATILAGQGIDNALRIAPVDAKLAYDDAKGYHVINGEIGTQIDFTALSEQLLNQAGESQTTIDLAQSYARPTISEDSDVVTTVMANIHQVANKKVILNIAGEDVEIPSKLIESWIHFDNDNKLVLDESLVESYLTELNDKYSTFNKERKFQSTLQGEVTVPPGILGWEIDIEKELPQLLADLYGNKQEIKREPAIYSTGGVPNAKDDIGRKYVEVDISNQMMYLYIDGEPMLSSNVVTGQPGAPTIPGANAVIEMLTDTKLRGYNPFYKKEYAVDVSYWIRFDHNAQGIHDASWQPQFGGDTYTWSGSLGCVNTPYENVAYLYEQIEYGTPVIVFE